MHIDETYYNPFKKGKGIIKDYRDGITQCYCINPQGELLFKFEPHLWAFQVEEDDVIFVSNNSDTYGVNDYHALFDSNGNQLTNFVYDAICGGSEEGFFEAQKDRKWGHLSTTGEEVIPFIYDESMYFTEGVSGMKLGDKWGMVNYRNETVIPFEYEEIGFCENNRITAKKGGKWGVIDKFNNVVIDFKFDELPYAFWAERECGSTYARLGDKYGIIDIYGQTLFDFVYDEVDKADDDGRWYKFRKDDKWALYSCENNRFISPFMYDEIDFYTCGLFEVKIGERNFYVDKENRPIADENCKSYELFCDSNLIAFEKDGKSGIMNTGGKVLIEPKYEDRFRHYSEGLFVLRDKNYYEYVMDIDENIIIPKMEYWGFWCGFSDGIISTHRGYYTSKGKKLKLKFEME